MGNFFKDPLGEAKKTVESGIDTATEIVEGDELMYALNPALAFQADYLMGPDEEGGSYNPYGGSSWDAHLSEMPELNLAPYEGPTDVMLSPSLKRTIALTDKVVQSPKYLDMLNPDPDYEDLETAYNMSRRKLEQHTKPGIDAAFSGGPYGSAYHGGERADARMSADLDLNERYQAALIEERRYQENLALQAAGFLPVATNIQSIETQNDINNLNRKMQVHYANEGLKVAEFNADLSAINAALGISAFETSRDLAYAELDMQRKAMEQAEDAAMGSMVGGIIGGIAGFGLSGGNPIGGMLGYQAGSAIGAGVSGGGAYAAPYVNSSAQSAMEMYYLTTMMNPPTPAPSIYPNVNSSVGFANPSAAASYITPTNTSASGYYGFGV